MRPSASRSGRTRERLGEVLPSLLDAFGRTAEPDLALATFDKVVADMPAGVQLFSLLAANPSLTRLIADIMGMAPRLAAILGRRPRLLDAVLDPGFFGAVPTPAKLKELVERTIGEARDYQEALDRARIVGREQSFLIGVRVISGTISALQAGTAYATLAETLIEMLAQRVGAELEAQYGRMPCGFFHADCGYGAPAEGLEAERSGPGKQFQDANPGHAVSKTVEDRLLNQVRSRTQIQSFWNLEPLASCSATCDPHGMRLVVEAVVSQQRKFKTVDTRAWA
jgi:hypothetical protein